jgi:hypothetical protein
MAPPLRRVAHEARAQPLEHQGAAPAALRQRRHGRRLGGDRRRLGSRRCGFVDAWRQWSSVVLGRATLMRHIPSGGDVRMHGSRRPAVAPVPRAPGVGRAAAKRLLVASGRLPSRGLTRQAAAGASAVPVAAVAAAAKDHLCTATLAHEQPGRVHSIPRAGRSRPGAPHCGGTVLYWHLKGAARSISLAGDEDRCRARLLRLGCVVQRARLRRAEQPADHPAGRPAARARRGQVTCPQGKPVDSPFGVRDLPTAPRRLAFGLTRCACRTADLEIEKKPGA